MRVHTNAQPQRRRSRWIKQALVFAQLSLLLGAFGCEAESATLLVQLQTNYRPGVDFDRVEVSWRRLGSDGVRGPMTAAPSREVTTEAAVTTGFVVAELPGVPPGDILVEGRLMRGTTLVATDERLAVSFRDSRAITLLVSRECDGVLCPVEGLNACVGGECVDPRCTPEAPEFCPFGCTDDAGCAPAGGPDCVEGLCFAGTCVEWLDDGQCPMGVCDANDGCAEATMCTVDTDCVLPPTALSCEVGSCLANNCYAQPDRDLCTSGRCDQDTECDAPACSAPGPATSIVEIEAGRRHVCARTSSGSVYCWGDNEFGQLGDGTQTDSSTPVLVMGLTDAVEISAGYTFTCARRATTQVVCWGENNRGELGNGTVVPSLTPTPVTGLTDVASLAAGSFFTCARMNSGAVMCWGSNFAGQIGNGDDEGVDVLTPTAVLGLSDAVQVSASIAFCCARRATGEVVCWGDNEARQLGDETIYPFQDQSLPVTVVGLSGVEEIGTGQGSVCARQTSGEVVCWGDYAETPEGCIVGEGSPTPVPEAAYRDAIEMVGSCCHRCALLSSGGIFCVGSNRDGEIGRGDVINDGGRIRDSTRCISDAVEITAGRNMTCARRASGEVLCWGNNVEGQLGDGTTSDHLTPTTVIGLPTL